MYCISVGDNLVNRKERPHLTRAECLTQLIQGAMDELLVPLQDKTTILNGLVKSTMTHEDWKVAVNHLNMHGSLRFFLEDSSAATRRVSPSSKLFVERIPGESWESLATRASPEVLFKYVDGVPRLSTSVSDTSTEVCGEASSACKCIKIYFGIYIL